MVTETSMEAYRSIVDDKETMKMQVYKTIKLARRPSNKDIARLMNKEINSITPRVNELVKDGLVEVGGIKTDPFSSRRCQWWKIKADGGE